MLTIEQIKIWYKPGTDIIKGVDLTLDAHSVTGFLGVNGAGKSTLIHTISDVHDRYSASRILFQGSPCGLHDSVFKKSRYTVFTDEQAFQYWNFQDYIAFVSKAYGKKTDPSYVDRLVAGFHFGPYVSQELKDLSTGNRKKAFLITGFSLQLPLLILDEPLDGLDFDSSEFLYLAINDYKQYGAVFMSSHIAESFEKTCDTLLVLDDGKITREEIQPGIDIRTQLKGWLHG